MWSTKKGALIISYNYKTNYATWKQIWKLSDQFMSSYLKICMDIKSRQLYGLFRWTWVDSLAFAMATSMIDTYAGPEAAQTSQP